MGPETVAQNYTISSEMAMTEYSRQTYKIPRGESRENHGHYTGPGEDF